MKLWMSGGFVFFILFSFVNAPTIFAVSPSSSTTPSSSDVVAVSQPSKPIEQATKIDGVEARAVEDRVVLDFRAVPGDRTLLIFRSPDPIHSVIDLQKATLVAETKGADAPYLDSPPVGQDFYYAVIDKKDFLEASANVFQTNQSTPNSTGLPSNLSPQTDLDLDPSLIPVVEDPPRPLPLPGKVWNKDITSETTSPGFLWDKRTPVKLRQSTLDLLARYAKPGPTVLPYPTVLTEEKTRSSAGSARQLARIVEAYFEQADWDRTIKQLRILGSYPLDDKTKSRLEFYLAQSLAYLGDFRRATLTLLSANDLEFSLRQTWLNALLDKLPIDTN